MAYQHATVELGCIKLDVFRNYTYGFYAISLDSLAELCGTKPTDVINYLHSDDFKEIYGTHHNPPTVKMSVDGRSQGFCLIHLTYAIHYIKHRTCKKNEQSQPGLVTMALIGEALELRCMDAFGELTINGYKAVTDSVDIELHDEINFLNECSERDKEDNRDVVESIKLAYEHFITQTSRIGYKVTGHLVSDTKPGKMIAVITFEQQ
jgi:hypothetical protein